MFRATLVAAVCVLWFLPCTAAAEGTDASGNAAVDAGLPDASAPQSSTQERSPAVPASDQSAVPGGLSSPSTVLVPPAETATTTPAVRPLVVLIDAAPIGVDPQAGAFVTEVLRQTLTQLGHPIVPTMQLYDVARQLQLPFPVPPDGVVTVLRLLNAPIGVTAEVRGGGGYYYATLRVRFVNEANERVRQLVATQWTLGDTLRSTLPVLLSPTPPTETTVMPGVPEVPGLPVLPRRRPVRLHPRPWEFSGGLELAIGPGQDSFVNVLASARAAYFPWDRLGFTASVAYANLQGRRGRVSNILPMVGIETGLELLPRQRIFLPLRAEVGYLPFNGPVLRGTAGLSFAITRDIGLELDILVPTVWFLPGSAALSLDLGVQVIYGTGGRARSRHRRRRVSETDASTHGVTNAVNTAHTTNTSIARERTSPVTDQGSHTADGED